MILISILRKENQKEFHLNQFQKRGKIKLKLVALSLELINLFPLNSLYDIKVWRIEFNIPIYIVNKWKQK